MQNGRGGKEREVSNSWLLYALSSSRHTLLPSRERNGLGYPAFLRRRTISSCAPSHGRYVSHVRSGRTGVPPLACQAGCSAPNLSILRARYAARCRDPHVHGRKVRTRKFPRYTYSSTSTLVICPFFSHCLLRSWRPFDFVFPFR